MKKYTLRKQIDQRGIYAEIEFEVYFTEGAPNELEVLYKAEPRWEMMCRAGIFIFFDYFLTRKKGRLQVKIHDIDWIPVDTNDLIVFYATIKALSEALNFPIEGLELDEITESFHFPEKRWLIKKS